MPSSLAVEHENNRVSVNWKDKNTVTIWHGPSPVKPYSEYDLIAEILYPEATTFVTILTLPNLYIQIDKKYGKNVQNTHFWCAFTSICKAICNNFPAVFIYSLKSARTAIDSRPRPTIEQWNFRNIDLHVYFDTLICCN